MYYKGALLGRVASKMKREALRLPGIRVLHGYSHREALEAHLTRLPPIDPRDLPTLEQMRRAGVQILSLDALGLPESPAMFAAAETLADELRSVKVNGDNAPRIPYARLMELPEIYAWGLSERLLSIAENYIGLPIRYHGADVRREVADGQPNDVRLFHIDTEDHRMLRVILYLNDVKPGGGPFEYIPREQTLAVVKKLHYGSGFVSDERMAQALPRSRMATGDRKRAYRCVRGYLSRLSPRAGADDDRPLLRDVHLDVDHPREELSVHADSRQGLRVRDEPSDTAPARSSPAERLSLRRTGSRPSLSTTMRARVSRLAWLPPLLAFAVFVFEARRFSGKSLYFVDDPFISMRFAANLVTRGELSFNPGDKIEGYSNLLHVLVHAAVFKFQGGVPDAAVAIDGAALVVFVATLLEALLLGVLALRARRQGVDGTAWYCAWVLTMASWPFAFWASAGMETPIEGLFYLSILLAIAAMVSRGATASGPSLAILGVLLVGVTLLRFEGVIVAVTIALALSVHLVRTQQTRGAVLLTVPVVFAAAAYHLWRIAYFGTLLPNTFIAKATGGSALGRLQAGASYCGGWVAFLGGGLGIAALALAVARTHRLGREAFARIAGDPVRLVAGALVLIKVALVVWGGGDWMPGWRMLLPVTPIALFLIFRGLLASVENGPALLTSRSGAIALALLVVVCGRGNAEFSPPHGTIPDEAGGGKKIPKNYVDAGRFLERTLGGSTEEVAIGEAGLVPFEALDVRFMDLFGLVDRDMARQPGWMHNRVHVAHVLERAPGAVMFAHLQLLPPYGPYQYGPELLASPAFHAAYRLVDVGPDLEAFGWALYLRRDLDPAAHNLVWASHDPRARDPVAAPAK